MADAEFTFKATGAETVVAANKRIEQSMQQQAKASGKSGYAVLEASRALEDFSMAGMRGALNNIPQLLLNLGVGAGLTGVLGALTVVVWKGTDYLDKFLTKLKDLEDAKFDKGIKLFDADAIELAFSEKAISNAKEILSVFSDLEKSYDYLNHLTGIYNKEREGSMELAFAKEMLSLTKNNADEDEKGLATLRYKIALEEESKEIAKDKVRFAQEQLDLALKEKNASEGKIAKSREFDGDALNKKVKAFYIKESSKLLAEKIMTDIPDAYGNRTGKTISAKRYSEADAFSLATDNANKYRAELLKSIGITEEELTQKIEEAATEREKIKLIDIEIKKKKDALQLAKDNADSAEKLADFKIEELSTMEEIAELERAKKKQEEEDKKSKLIEEKSIDASSFLSSQGRVGMAGNEAKTAMDALSISKQQLKKLDEIARNTKYGRKTAYN